MPAAKKRVKKKNPLVLRVSNMDLEVEVVPEEEVAKANARIQRKVQPVFHQIKKTRRAAAITASKIILNA